MDQMRAIEADAPADAVVDGREGVPDDRPPAIGTDERRMHVRAYNFWVSLLGGRAYPSIADLDPGQSLDFGPHSVLLDFTGGADEPAIAYIGEALRIESGAPSVIRTVADVPSRSLLSRLTDHYLQILANRAPIGFEAEFQGQRGLPTLYRGILMPFSSDDDTIDFVYGIINWKELAEPDQSAAIAREAAAAMGLPSPAPAWADGPGGALGDELFDDADDFAPEPDVLNADAGLVDRLAAARALAEQAGAARVRSRAALYRALGLAYDFALAANACPADYAALLVDAGIRVQRRAPMTAIVKLVFGATLDKARITEFAASLDHAQRLRLAPGRFAAHVEAQRGGLKALVAAEREARRPPIAPMPPAERARAALRRAPAQMHLDLPSGDAEFVLVLARREADGRLAVLAPVPDESALVDRAIRKVTR